MYIDYCVFVCVCVCVCAFIACINVSIGGDLLQKIFMLSFLSLFNFSHWHLIPQPERRWLAFCPDRSLCWFNVAALWCEDAGVTEDLIYPLACAVILNLSGGVTIQFSSVAQLCPTLCDPMDCSTPGLTVHHLHLEFTQIHVHWLGNAIQPFHLLSSPSPPTLNLS